MLYRATVQSINCSTCAVLPSIHQQKTKDETINIRCDILVIRIRKPADRVGSLSSL